MLVAVTGGTGFVGSAVVEALLQAGHELRVLARRAPAGEARDGVSYMRGSVVSGEGLGPFVQGAEAVVHLVGIIREQGTNTFESVHHIGTRNVVQEALRSGVRRYVHMSALGSREGGVSTYHRTKWAGEMEVRKSTLDFTIFRPSIIFGPGDAFINMLVGVMRKTPIMPLIGGGKNLMQPVYVHDVAKAFTFAVEAEATRNRTYELGGPDVLTLRQILEIVAQVMNKKRIYIPVPWSLAALSVRLFQSLGLPLPVTSDQLIMLREDNVRSGGDPTEELGIRWTPLEEGIRKYLGSRV